MSRLVVLTNEQRFWARVDVSGECWLWTGARIRDTYGRFFTAERRSILAHRYAYELTHGPIPEGFEICHHCDNPPCVRPDHLFAGTKSDNMRDSFAKGRQRRDGEHSRRTHLTWQDVRIIRGVAGWIPTRLIAERYRISESEVRTIVTGRAWHGDGEDAAA